MGVSQPESRNVCLSPSTGVRECTDPRPTTGLWILRPGSFTRNFRKHSKNNALILLYFCQGVTEQYYWSWAGHCRGRNATMEEDGTQPRTELKYFRSGFFFLMHHVIPLYRPLLKKHGGVGV